MLGTFIRSGDSLQNERYFIYLFIYLFIIYLFIYLFIYFAFFSACLRFLENSKKRSIPVLQAKGDF